MTPTRSTGTRPVVAGCSRAPSTSARSSRTRRCSPTTRSAPGKPDPPYKWIPSNVNPPPARPVPPDPQPRVRPGAGAAGRGEGPRVLPHGDRRGPGQGRLRLRGRGRRGVPDPRLPGADRPAVEDAPLLCAWTETHLRRVLPRQPRRDGRLRRVEAVLRRPRRRPAGATPPTPTTTSRATCWRPRSTATPMTDDDMLNIFNQLMLAGLDTVKSAMSLRPLHLATHAGDRRRVVERPGRHPDGGRGVPAGLPAGHGGPQAQPDIDFHGVRDAAGRDGDAGCCRR